MSDATLSLKVMVNKEKGKVLFAEADNDFVDILLSFLTLPLGRILKILDNHYGEKAPTIGSLSSLYHSLDNLNFVTEGAKQALLNPQSSFEAEYERLKLDITDFHPAEYFCCSISRLHTRFRSVSIYLDNDFSCKVWGCSKTLQKEVATKGSGAAASGDGVFTVNTTSFIISDDLQIFPVATGLFQIISVLDITDMLDSAEVIKVTIGLNEMLSLLKASFISPTPLSDVILNKTSTANVESQTKMFANSIESEGDTESKKMVLKVAVQTSTGKLLYAEGEDDFVEFLHSLVYIPVGGVEHLLAGETCFKAINNLYRSANGLIDDEYFKTPNTKMRLMKPNVVHGCISENHILPLTQEPLPEGCINNLEIAFGSRKFPKGQGRYLKGPTTYVVMNDLTVTPFCISRIISSLKKQNIPISDVKQVKLQIGLKEGLSILKASLASTSALSDALLNHVAIKQPKREV